MKNAVENILESVSKIDEELHQLRQRKADFMNDISLLCPVKVGEKAVIKTDGQCYVSYPGKFLTVDRIFWKTGYKWQGWELQGNIDKKDGSPGKIMGKSYVEYKK